MSVLFNKLKGKSFCIFLTVNTFKVIKVKSLNTSVYFNIQGLRKT